MRKGDDGGEKKREKNGEKKIKTFLVATNVIASRPPERGPTGTPTACANFRRKENTIERLCVQDLCVHFNRTKNLGLT